MIININILTMETITIEYADLWKVLFDNGSVEMYVA